MFMGKNEVTMKVERYQQLMNIFGMPNSQSLLSLLQQVVNEAGHEAMIKEREACKDICRRYPDLPAGYALEQIEKRIWL